MMDALDKLLLKNAKTISITCIESIHINAVEVKFGFHPSKDVLDPIERLFSAGACRSPKSSEQFVRIETGKLVLTPLDIGWALCDIYQTQGFDARLYSEVYDDKGALTSEELTP